MKHHVKEKFKAFTIHLFISISVISVFLWFVKSYWFPGTLFVIENAWEGLKILIPVDAVLGPILTLVLYSPKKKNLRTDLSIIVLVQLLALAYGGWVIYDQRPVLIAFDVKEFRVITAAEQIRENIPSENLITEQNGSLSVVYALAPNNKEEVVHFLSSPTPYYKTPSRLHSISSYREKMEEAAVGLKSLVRSGEKTKKELNSLLQLIASNPEIYLFHLRGSLGSDALVAVDLKQEKAVGFFDKSLVEKK